MKKPTVVLGFDYGLKRIGVAVGQSYTATATALTTLQSNAGRPDWEAITQLVQDWQPTALVVGLPKNMDGSEHKFATEVRYFAAELQRRHHLAVYLIDERLSSYEAESIATRSRRRKPSGRAAKQELDRLAAQIILETWLAEHVDH